MIPDDVKRFEPHSYPDARGLTYLSSRETFWTFGKFRSGTYLLRVQEIMCCKPGLNSALLGEKDLVLDPPPHPKLHSLFTFSHVGKYIATHVCMDLVDCFFEFLLLFHILQHVGLE